MKAKEVRRLMSDVRRWEEERRCEDKRDNAKSDSKAVMYVPSIP